MSAEQIELAKKQQKYRPSSTRSSRPATSDYDRARTADIMEEGGPVDSIPRMTNSGKLACAVGGGVVLFLVIFSAVLIVDSVHTIEEGNVGIYFVQGALDDRYSLPGIHWATPFVTVIEEVTIRPQTETLEAISTVTRDGIQNTFHNIQVLSNVDVGYLIPLIKKFGMQFRRALIYDRVAEELRTFCANHTIDEVFQLQ